MTRPNILITNDDGFDAPGLQTLWRTLKDDYNIFIVAPLSQKSGAGCGFTVHHPFTSEKRFDETGNLIGFAVDGTPVDCVKFAHAKAPDFKADLVLSGINDGGNFGKSFWYSGTVAGAVEATLCGYRAAAISIWNNKASERPFEELADYFKPVIPWLLKQNFDPDHFWNFNLPNTPGKAPQGYRFATIGESHYQSAFMPDEEANGTVMHQYEGGRFVRKLDDSKADDSILSEGFATVSLVRMRPAVELPGTMAESLNREVNAMLTPGEK